MKTSGQYNVYPTIHGAAMSAHGTPWFLPWHRVMLFKFEEDLRAIDPCVTLPYWDWSLDSPSEISSPVFAASAFGAKLGSPGTFCTTNGATFGWTPSTGGQVLGSCVSRRASVAQFTDTSTLVGLLATPNYATFWPSIEGGPHGSVHMYVGGTSASHMGNIQWSPDDPLFFLHHAFVDAIWAAWQACHLYDAVSAAALTTQIYSGTGSFGRNNPMTFTSAPWAAEGWTPADAHTVQGMGYKYSFDAFSTSSLLPGICLGNLAAHSSYGYITPSASATTCRRCVDESPLFGWCKTSYGGG